MFWLLLKVQISNIWAEFSPSQIYEIYFCFRDFFSTNSYLKHLKVRFSAIIQFQSDFSGHKHTVFKIISDRGKKKVSKNEKKSERGESSVVWQEKKRVTAIPVNVHWVVSLIGCTVQPLKCTMCLNYSFVKISSIVSSFINWGTFC